MTERQGKIFTAAFMTVTLGAVIAGPILALWTGTPEWLLLCFAIIFYL
jgi:hypothetical protein